MREQQRLGLVKERGVAASEEERSPIQRPSDGTGPLLQRDYVVVLEGSGCTPEAAVERIRTDFPGFSPASVARFTRPEGITSPLEVGDTMHVRIRGVGDCGVQVTHRDAHSLTLRTLKGHPE